MKKDSIFISLMFLAFGFSMIFYACQESYIPETSEADQEIVVEGYVEAGPGSNPVFVLLTKSLPFIGEIDASVLESLFIRSASVEVNDGDKTILLTELCLNQLPEEIRMQAAAVLGINADSVGLNICAYVDILDAIDRAEGKTYNLNIVTDNEVVTATTTIPRNIPLTSFRWSDPPGEPNDTLATLNVTIADPKEEENYYRYFTGPIDGPVMAPFASVTNDVFFNGKNFEFPLNKAQGRGDHIDPETFGLFSRGDSVIIKWTNIDKDHFEFWNTLEFSANSAGPFSSYIRVNSNIEGGLGIWGGYAVQYYRLYSPPK